MGRNEGRLHCSRLPQPSLLGASPPPSRPSNQSDLPQKIIYISMAEHRLGEPQSRKWHHISHCFDALRRQVLCDADDTPRTVQRELEGVSGVGQNRQCRDWGELERWAKAHTACYKRPDRPVEGMRNIEKYKFCPEGSGYEVPQDLVQRVDY